MAYQKGEKVETGIWRLAGSKLYLAEVSYREPHTDRRVRERRTTHRLDLAREWRQTRKADALRGEVTRQKKRNVVLFRDFAGEYLRVWSRDRKPSTVYGERNRIRGVLKPYFGDKPIHTITRKDIETFLTRRREGAVSGVAGGRKGQQPGAVSNATVNRDLARLKSMFKKAVDWGYLEVSPAAGIKQAREHIREADFLDREEVAQLLAVCEDEVRPLLVTAVNTGMRWGELMKLEWGDVDFDQGLITVRDPKNRETRYVPMNRAVREALAEHRKAQARQTGKLTKLVFANPETGKPWVDLRKPFFRALRKAGIDRHFTFHGLRHTAASHLVMAGVDLRTVGKILGHKTAQITLRYAHLAPDYLRGAVERLDYSEPGKAVSSTGRRFYGRRRG